MAQFRKRPVVVEATLARWLIQAADKDWYSMPEWFRAAYEAGIVGIRPDGISIATLEGTMEAAPTDWVICGVKGELYPIKPDIFEATYERVEQPT